VRKTQFNENILWVKNVFHEGMGEKPTHIALYDIVDRQCLAEIDIEPFGLNVIFSILPAFREDRPSGGH
jgi:pyruvoyl-dependent arginine decarboxylase (PvlArgDC)